MVFSHITYILNAVLWLKSQSEGLKNQGSEASSTGHDAQTSVHGTPTASIISKASPGLPGGWRNISNAGSLTGAKATCLKEVASRHRMLNTVLNSPTLHSRPSFAGYKIRLLSCRHTGHHNKIMVYSGDANWPTENRELRWSRLQLTPQPRAQWKHPFTGRHSYLPNWKKSTTETAESQNCFVCCLHTHTNVHVHAHSNAHTPAGTNLNRDLLPFLLLFPPSISSLLGMVLQSEGCAHSSAQALLCPSLVQGYPPPMPSPCCHPHEAGPWIAMHKVAVAFWEQRPGVWHHCANALEMIDR